MNYSPLGGRRFGLSDCLSASLLASNLGILALFVYFAIRLDSAFDDLERSGDEIAAGVQNISVVFDRICEGLQSMGWCEPRVY